MKPINLVTGATGLLGSHVAEQLTARRLAVRALVRPSSDTRFLQSLGVELVEGDLADPESLEAACHGADVVYHCAAKVGDWGPWREYQTLSIDATRHICEACSDAGVGRLLYISSISAYGHPAPRAVPISEDEPLGQDLWTWDHYARAKAIAEDLVWEHHEATGLPVTVIRPSWLYGPRDRASIHRMIAALRAGKAKLIGPGDNRLNLAYAGNVAEGAILAAHHPGAVGQAYNLSNDGYLTQRGYWDLVADAIDAPRVTAQVPYRVVFTAAFALEAAGKLLRLRRPPLITRYAAWLIGRTAFYSTDKAQEQLGWQPRVGYEEGVRRTVEWYLQAEGQGTDLLGHVVGTAA